VAPDLSAPDSGNGHVEAPPSSRPIERPPIEAVSELVPPSSPVAEDEDAAAHDEAGLVAPVATASPVERDRQWNGGPSDHGRQADASERGGSTAPQLRRFIKSRAYVPMHELRRRFAINGPEDDVSAIDVEGNRVFVGLPEAEGRLLAELLRAGDIGYELSLDPISPIVVGVYPMRPVPRP
jgi:hypothetical protein